LGEIATWLASSVLGTAEFVVGMTFVWPPLCWLIGILMFLSVAAAIGPMWRRCRPACLMLLLLSVELVVAGALGLWPVGRSRTMTFVVPFVAFAAGAGLYELVCRIRGTAAFVLLAICIAAPFARGVKATIVGPPTAEHVRPIFEHIESRRQAGDAVFVYYAVDEAYRYYCDGSTIPAMIQPRGDRGDIEAFGRRFDSWIGEHGRVWLVMAHPWQDEAECYAERLAAYKACDTLQIGDATGVLYAVRSLPVSQE
jgi:hypothetical protein